MIPFPRNENEHESANKYLKLLFNENLSLDLSYFPFKDVSDIMQPLVNRVANSKLITIKIEELVPPQDYFVMDLADFLWKGMALKEKDFRSALKNYDWEILKDKVLCIHCSTAAIIPQWAYLLISVYAAPVCRHIHIGSPEQAEQAAFTSAVNALDISIYQDQMVVIKGCTEGRNLGAQAYATLTQRLQPIVKSIMYGEPCSTVPIYKKKNK